MHNSRGEKMYEKERIKWLDVCKGICMICVVLSHSVHPPEIVAAFYRPFFLAGFFFATGFTFKVIPCREFMTKRVKTLLIPWLLWGTIDLVMVSIFGQDHNVIRRVVLNLLQIKGFYDALWFLPCTFIVSLFLDGLLRKFSVRRTLTILVVLTVLNRLFVMLVNPELLPWRTLALPWHIHLLGPVGLIMLFGYMTSKGVINKVFGWPIPELLFVFFYLLVSGFQFLFHGKVTELLGGGTILWVLLIFTGIITVKALSCGLKKNRLLSYIGKNSLLFFCIHVIIIRFANKAFERLYILCKGSPSLCFVLPIVETGIVIGITALGVEAYKRGVQAKMIPAASSKITQIMRR